jgi:uncharacterized membrane-anchored protein
METHRPRPATVVAVTSEQPGHASVRRRAAAIATDAGSTVILWYRSAEVSPLESPLPTSWSGESEEEQFGDRLGPDDLEAAGANRSRVRSTRCGRPASTRGAGSPIRRTAST